MPQALAFVAPAVFGVGGSVALVTAAGTLTLAGIAVSIGGTLLLGALTQPDTPDRARPENIQINTKTAAGNRVRHYGIVKTGGNIVLHRARDGYSYRIVAHGHGEISSVLQYYLNKEPVGLNVGGFVTDAQYQWKRSRVQILDRLGLVPASPYAEVTGVWAEWTDAHRLDGQWSSLIICESVKAEEYRKMYPRNEPDLIVLAETTKCYDPRIDVTQFTENMALAIADYVSSADGFNRPDAFDASDIALQADICDRDVPLNSGGTEKLYQVSGSYLLNEKPQAVLGRMLSACAGRVRLRPTGKIGLKVGAWSVPEFTLKYTDIVEVQEVNSGPDLLDRYNELPARFTSHDLGHVEVDAEPWRDPSRVALDGDVLTGPDKVLLMCPSHRQARQVMKIHMERDNPRQTVTLQCKPKALPAIYEDTIALDIPQLALIGDYEVARHSLSFERGLIKSVGLVLRKVDSSAFNLLLSEQGQVQQLPEPDTSAGVPVPQNMIAAGAGIQTASDTFTAGIAVVWQEPPSDALSPVLKVRVSGQDDWQDLVVNSDAVSMLISGLVDGQDYDVSLSFKTPTGVIGDAVVLDDIQAAAVTEPPLSPVALSVLDQGAGVAIVEMTASVSSSLWKTEIYRDSVLVGVVYAGPGAEISFVDSSGAGTFSWSARSVNVSNTNSVSDAGPVVATIA